MGNVNEEIKKVHIFSRFPSYTEDSWLGNIQSRRLSHVSHNQTVQCSKQSEKTETENQGL